MHSKRSLLVVAAAILSLAALAPAVAASVGGSHSRTLYITKECSEYTGAAGGFCTITSSPSSVDGWLSRLVASELQIEDDSILDPGQHQLVLDGRRVDLTKLEFDVIDYLYERKGTVVKRSDLLHDVWGYDYAGGSNVIEANVRSLRHKLGDHADLIETVRGLGYRFRASA